MLIAAPTLARLMPVSWLTTRMTPTQTDHRLLKTLPLQTPSHNRLLGRVTLLLVTLQVETPLPVILTLEASAPASMQEVAIMISEILLASGTITGSSGEHRMLMLASAFTTALMLNHINKNF